MMNNSIIIKLRGGLGNQLFQYAFAAMLKDCYIDKKIVIDASYFRKEHIRSLEIDKLCLDEHIEWMEHNNTLFDMMYWLYRMYNKLLHRRFQSKKPFQIGGNIFVFCDKALSYSYSNLKFNNAFLAGYFQQADCLERIKTHLIHEIVPKKMSKIAEGYYNEIKDGSVIGISIRAGEDYVRFGWPICSKEYYERGLDLLYTGEEKIVVFADVIDKIKEKQWFAEHNVIYVQGCNSVEALYLLSLCDSYVISNSTFSWWGAWLSTSQVKKIVSPEYFYAGIKTRNSALHVDNMIILNNSGERIND